jgi:hypothetical protein
MSPISTPRMSDTPRTATKKIIDFTCIERYTECSFCLEQFKEPRILPCSHTYCTICLVKITNNNVDSLIKCPQCLRVHNIEDKGIIMFARNLALEQLIDLKPTQIVSSNKCEVCCLNYGFTKCLHCFKVCCLECKETHRDECKVKLNGLFDDLISKSNLIIDKLKSELNEFIFNGNNVKIRLNKLVEIIIEQIKEKEKVLYSEIDKVIEEKMR